MLCDGSEHGEEGGVGGAVEGGGVGGVLWREGWGLQRGRGREVRSEQVGQASPNPQIP